MPASSPLPQSIEVTATINADNPIPGRQWSNAFLIFDYVDPSNFKFAGTFLALDQWVIGHAARNANGYVVDKVLSERVDTLTDYDVKLDLTGDTATLSLGTDGAYRPAVSYRYAGDDLRDGRIGLGTMRATARFDDFALREVSAAASTTTPASPATEAGGVIWSETITVGSAPAATAPPAQSAQPPVSTPTAPAENAKPAETTPPAASTPTGTLLASEDFDDGTADRFDAKVGLWRVEGSKYLAQYVDQNLISLLSLDRSLPDRVDVRVTFNADGVTSTRWSNAFVVFDYHSPTDYKFAGAFVGINQWAIGRMTPRGYVVDKSVNESIDAGKDYGLEVRLEGSNVALTVDGGVKVSHTFAAPLQQGQLGLATLRGNARFDDFSVEEY